MKSYLNWRNLQRFQHSSKTEKFFRGDNSKDHLLSLLKTALIIKDFNEIFQCKTVLIASKATISIKLSFPLLFSRVQKYFWTILCQIQRGNYSLLNNFIRFHLLKSSIVGFSFETFDISLTFSTTIKFVVCSIHTTISL